MNTLPQELKTYKIQISERTYTGQRWQHTQIAQTPMLYYHFTDNILPVREGQQGQFSRRDPRVKSLESKQDKQTLSNWFYQWWTKPKIKSKYTYGYTGQRLPVPRYYTEQAQYEQDLRKNIEQAIEKTRQKYQQRIIKDFEQAVLMEDELYKFVKLGKKNSSRG